MENLRNQWDETTAGTSGGATATHAGETGKVHTVKRVDGHTDTSSIVTLKDGTTIVKEWRVVPYVFSFPCDDIKMTSGAAAVANIASSTSDCQVNMIGNTVDAALSSA